MVVAHATWLVCVGGLPFFVHVCALGGGHAMDGVFLLYFLITSACRTIASLCTFGCWNVASVATNMYLLRTLACSSHFHFTSMRSHALTFPISSHAQS